MFVIFAFPIHYIRDNMMQDTCILMCGHSSAAPVWGWVKVVLRPNDSNVVHEVPLSLLQSNPDLPIVSGPPPIADSFATTFSWGYSCEM